ncbi:flagellar basal body rod protein FlgB [Thiobacter aerophilum]|uniref:Flagellar basal body rod protein FlgB n=1 Tax=Thiobacter aerophilum TaxID=3121275 RepID=A0ABV0EHV1_9BURK
MMVDKLDRLFEGHAAALKLASFRQQLLASNIANADTPHYKAMDIDFAAELKRVIDGGAAAGSLVTTHPRHLPGNSANPLGAQVRYRSDVQGNIDGNTVDMDRERAQFAENALRYEAIVRVLNTQIQHMKAALRTQ